MDQLILGSRIVGSLFIRPIIVDPLYSSSQLVGPLFVSLIIVGPLFLSSNIVDSLFQLTFSRFGIWAYCRLVLRSILLSGLFFTASNTVPSPFTASCLLCVGPNSVYTGGFSKKTLCLRSKHHNHTHVSD